LKERCLTWIVRLEFRPRRLPAGSEANKQDDAAEPSNAEASRRKLSERVKMIVGGLTSTASRMNGTATALADMAKGPGTTIPGETTAEGSAKKSPP
jgi:hypothetical protein